MGSCSCRCWVNVIDARHLGAWCDGFSLHAAVVIADHDREALERLCRYGARPAFAQRGIVRTKVDPGDPNA